MENKRKVISNVIHTSSHREFTDDIENKSRSYTALSVINNRYSFRKPRAGPDLMWEDTRGIFINLES